MNKLLLLTLTILGGAPLLAHTHKIINTTPSTVAVKVNVVAGPDKHYVLEPAGSKNSTVSSNVGGYCTRSIDVTGIAGPNAGENASGSLGSQAWETCRGITAYIECLNCPQQTQQQPQTGGQSVIVYAGGTTQPSTLQPELKVSIQ